LELTAVTGPSNIMDEGELDFAFKASNLGNGPDKFDLFLEKIPNNWEISLDREVELNSKKEYSGSVNIIIPENDTKEGIYNIKLTIVSKGDPSLEETMIINVTLEKTPDDSGIGDIIPDFENSDSKSSGSNLWAILLVALVILIGIIIIMAVVITQRKKGKKNKNARLEPEALVPTVVKPAVTKPAPTPGGQSNTSKGPENLEGGTVKQTTQDQRNQGTPLYAVPPKEVKSLPPLQKIENPAFDWENDTNENDFALDQAPNKVVTEQDAVLPPPPMSEVSGPEMEIDDEPDWDDTFNLDD